jgi:hypothetical protein
MWPQAIFILSKRCGYLQEGAVIFKNQNVILTSLPFNSSSDLVTFLFLYFMNKKGFCDVLLYAARKDPSF